MFRHPWHATNHCNTTFPEFMEREWSPGRLAGKLLLCSTAVTLGDASYGLPQHCLSGCMEAQVRSG